MSEAVVHTEEPRATAAREPVRDPSILEAYLEDASGNAPGRAAGLLRIASEAEAAAFLRATAGKGVCVLPQAARSSLTGGAVPDGEVVLSVERMGAVGALERDAGGARVTVEPGVRLKDLQRELAERGFYYPPVPTYQEAMIGGTVSTNAGGSATFKYGVTRQWVRALRVVLAEGDVLSVERGQALAPRGGTFRIRRPGGAEIRVPVPDHRLPPLKKISAGYFSSDPMDLVDLFVGSEGTLGLVTRVTVDLVPLPPGLVTGLVFVPGVDEALSLASDLRRAASAARESRDPRGPDVRAIEFVDGESLRLLRRHGDVRRLSVAVPEEAGAALLFEMELPEATSDERAQRDLEVLLERPGEAADVPLVRLFRLLLRHAALEGLEFAFPEDEARQEALREFREAVPKRVNEILASRRRDHPGVRKAGGDLIVPVSDLREMLRIYEDGFRRRGLEFAIWGHVSDGNLHPNAIARSGDEWRLAAEALLEFGDEARRRGGSPLSEHGVGRSPLKQELMRRFVGDAAIATMREVKKALDPEARFAPGVLFSA